jgi:hypothetical protein
MRQMSLAMLVLAMVAGTTAAQAQATPTGLVVNLHAFATPGFSIKGDDIDGAIETSLGPGIGAQIGYAFTPQYMVFVGFDIARLGASQDQSGHWGFGVVELGGRVNFPSPERRFTPYVIASYGRRGLGADVGNGGRVTFDGMAISGGGGAHYFISPSLALDGAVTLSYGKFSNYEDPFQEGKLTVDNTLTSRVRFGLNWYPLRPTR